MRTSLHRRPRGSALITTLWVVIALTGLVLALARLMRVEAISSANRLSEAQATAAERGTEQWLLSVVDTEIATPGSAKDVLMEARQIGGCYVWVLKPDPDDQQNRAYGLTDEAGKIDLNTATSAMLAMLPNMTQDVVDSIITWRSGRQTGQGADDSYYGSLTDPYQTKKLPFESVDELMLVRGVDRTLMFGYDRNRDGVLDDREMAAGGTAASFNAGNGAGRGIFPYLTVYGTRATATPPGLRLVDVNAADDTQLRNLLQRQLAGRTAAILELTRTNRPFANVFDWAIRTQVAATDLSKVFAQLTANPISATSRPAGGAAPTVAKLNVNTASRQALLCLPGLQDGDASAIITYCQKNTSTDPSDISWLLTVITTRSKLTSIGGLVTGRSLVYSGDIVALSPDARAFKRVRIVIDGGQNPSRIIYRRDLTSSGFPLPPEIRAAVRAGQVPPVSSSSSMTLSTSRGINPS